MVRTIDLDEILGHAGLVRVVFDGQEYVLRDPVVFTAEETLKRDMLLLEMNDLFSTPATDAAVYRKRERFLNEFLLLVGPALPVDRMPYALKERIVLWYWEELSRQKNTPFVEAATQSVPTGEMSSAS